MPKDQPAEQIPDSSAPNLAELEQNLREAQRAVKAARKLSPSPADKARAAHCQAMAHESWAATTDRTARTSAGRRAFNARFEAQVDPDGIMSPANRAKAAASARTAFFKRLAMKSVEARKTRRDVA